MKPINYSEALDFTFATSSCFIVNKLDKLDEVADSVFKFLQVPSGLISPLKEANILPTQRANPPRGEG